MSDIKTFIDVFSGALEILGILGGLISTAWAWHRKKTKGVGGFLVPPPQEGKKDWFLVFLYVVMFFFISLFLISLKAQFFPGFVITSPHDGQILISNSREVEIDGIGAHPGEYVTIVVSDGHTQFRQTGLGIPSEKGNWVVENVVLQTTNYEYTVWAETKENGTTVLSENRVKIIRMDDSQQVNAFIQNNKILLGLITVALIVTGIYIFPRGYKKVH